MEDRPIRPVAEPQRKQVTDAPATAAFTVGANDDELTLTLTGHGKGEFVLEVDGDEVFRVRCARKQDFTVTHRHPTLHPPAHQAGSPRRAPHPTWHKPIRAGAHHVTVRLERGRMETAEVAVHAGQRKLVAQAVTPARPART
jgi:hypothetical protein